MTKTKNTANRRGNQKAEIRKLYIFISELYKRCRTTYNKHMSAVDEKFNRDNSSVFFRDATSDDESETDLNELFDHLDELAVPDLGKRANQLKTRRFVPVKKLIPCGLVVKMSTWARC
ncbi:hypothetical protein PHYBLDRAFT_70838 [Phycomyces blakesleeanus NRRL 1555(-)]|uniref:Uncharacterized protein n=1 Tax=Phycomyces blakesleeanus (strain ATCC 8743b / DSM 1359 / FGSC 10004 / NBRC 33097 / NRRL 1555) TaxID=763407 RepID=A0A167JNR2_PHYB8|nr:hypothetical protein PHYBLDRAFT_70838 [Phycomyces blakesleeanus NRRL 1555(-)]OAD66378.1 hypothetical protein PHYBLDRAFT_70838 [Phycomyces blakesleeanus NRRL 1555(-)]|eukprot:XP_018284418.1 hypothetical protein PHYBLDRAFT_70838 [Phycomyces blakesleeanus NRRL 1555(-)]